MPNLARRGSPRVDQHTHPRGCYARDGGQTLMYNSYYGTIESEDIAAGDMPICKPAECPAGWTKVESSG